MTKLQKKRLIEQAFGNLIIDFYRPAMAGDKIDFFLFAVACRLVAGGQVNPLVAAIGFRFAEIGYSKLPIPVGYLQLDRLVAEMRKATIENLKGKNKWVLALELDEMGGVK